jgi:hypothetical protein
MKTIVHEAASGATSRFAQRKDPLWHFTLIYNYLKDHYESEASTYSPYTDYEELQGFWLARQGAYDDFLVDCQQLGMPIEWYQVTADAQPTVTDGLGSWFTPLQRNWAGLYQEDITDLNTGPTILANGQPVTTSSAIQASTLGLAVPGASYYGLVFNWIGWQASHAYSAGDLLIDVGGHLQMVTSPGTSGTVLPGFNDSGGTTSDGSVTWTDQGLASVTATFTFYMRMRFEEDLQDIELFMHDLWAIGGPWGTQGKGTIKLVSSRLPIESQCV